MLDLTVPVAQVGSRLELQCSVDAWPAPRLGVYRDTNLTVGLVGSEDSRVNITAWSSRSVTAILSSDWLTTSILTSDWSADTILTSDWLTGTSPAPSWSRSPS